MPWEAFVSVLQEGGVVAALFFLLLMGAGFFFYALWKQNQRLHSQLAALQDKRVKDALQMYERIGTHTGVIDRAMERLTHSFEAFTLYGRK